MSRLAIIIAFVLSILVCCTPQKTAENRNVVLAHKSNIPNELHPTNNNSSEKIDIFNHIHAFLLKEDIITGKLIPELLVAQPVFEQDANAYSCTLNTKAQFDNGKKVTSEDVVFTFKVHACEGVLNGTRKNLIQNVAGVLADGEDAFKILVKNRGIDDIYILSDFPILQRSFYDSLNVLNSFSFADLKNHYDSVKNKTLTAWVDAFNGPKFSTNKLQISGGGAYELKVWDAQQIILVKKEGHWLNERAEWVNQNNADEIVYKLNSDFTSRVLDVKNRFVDVSTGYSSKEVSQLRDDTAITNYYDLRMEPVFGQTLIAFNLRPKETQRAPLFTDQKVREAIAYALPIDMAMDKLSNGVAMRTVSFISPLKKEYNSNLKPYPYDIEKAKALMKEAGWADTDGDGVLDKEIDGEKIDFNLTIAFPSGALFNAVVSLLSQGLEELGLSLVFYNEADWQTVLYETKAFDMAIFSLTNSPGPSYPLALVQADDWYEGGGNFSGYANAAVDSLIFAISSTFNEEERKEQLVKLQEILYQELPYVYLSTGRRGILINKRFENVKTSGVVPMVMLNTLKPKN